MNAGQLCAVKRAHKVILFITTTWWSKNCIPVLGREFNSEGECYGNWT